MSLAFTTIFTDPVSDTLKPLVEAKALVAFAVAVKRGRQVAIPYSNTIQLLALPFKKAVLVLITKPVPDLLVLGANIKTNLATAYYPIHSYRPEEGNGFVTLDTYVPSILRTAYRILGVEFVIERVLDQDLFLVGNLFNEVVGNPTSSHLVCLSDKYPWNENYIIRLDEVYKTNVKIAALRKTARALTGTLEGKKFLIEMQTRITSFNSTILAALSGRLTENEDYNNIWVNEFNANPHLSFVVPTLITEGVIHIYDFEKSVDYFDITDIDNPAAITISAPVRLDESYFFDVSENALITPAIEANLLLEDIAPENVRYLFDFPIVDIGLDFPYTSLAFYFENGELKSRIYIGSRAYIHSFIVNKAVNFDTFVDIEITFVAYAGKQIDLNSPTQVPITEQVLYDPTNAWDGYNQEIINWTDIYGYTYYRTMLQSDYDGTGGGSVFNVENMLFNAAALPEIKTQNIPLIHKYHRILYRTFGEFSSPKQTIDITIYGKLLFNNYVTDFTYTTAHLIDNTYNVSSFQSFTSSATGLPIRSQPTKYAIAFDIFGDLIVMVETGSPVHVTNAGYGDYTQFQGYDVTQFYIISKAEVAEHITDIVSLINYLDTQTPISTLTPDYWATNTPATYSPTQPYTDSYPILGWDLESLHEYEQGGLGLSDLSNKVYSSHVKVSNIFFPAISWSSSSSTGLSVDITGYMPNISIVDDISYVGTLNSNGYWVKNITGNYAQRFHRIYLIDKDLNRVGRCDLQWSADFHFALAEFVRHHGNVLEIMTTKRANEEPLAANERAELTTAQDAYDTFNLTFGDRILYNDFASYELLYYIFGANDLTADTINYAGANQSVIITVITDNINEL